MFDFVIEAVTIHPLVTVGFVLLLAAIGLTILSGLIDILVYLLTLLALFLLVVGGVMFVSGALFLGYSDVQLVRLVLG